jgi:hypothetical protein
VIVGACLSIAAATGCKDRTWTPLGSADFILSEMKLRGAPAVSRRLDADENFGRSVTNGIASGDSVWLDVADKLIPASAASEATLSIALSAALIHSPTRVLPLLGQKYPVEEVCGMPFLKADSLAVVSYYDSAAGSLQKVSSASLAGVRDSCRVALDDARRRRLERINPGYLIKNKPVAPPRRRRR